MSSPSSDELRHRYSSYSDEALLAAYGLGASSYSSAAWQIIADEVAARRLNVASAPATPQPVTPPPIEGPLTTDGAVAFALQALTQGAPATGIREQLLAHGLPSTDVALLLEQTVLSWRNQADTAALKTLFAGGLWCGAGLAVTLLTYVFAGETGGYYIVAYGAVFFGGIRLITAFRRLDAVKKQCDLS